jgi:hypothetical protein
VGLFSRRQQVIVFDPNQPRFRASVKKAIIASAMGLEDDADIDALRRSAQAWQLEALGYRNRIGEVRYAGDFYARPLRRLRWYIGELQDDGTTKPTKNQRVIDIWNRIRDPGGGMQTLLTQYGRLMFGPGEAILLHTPDHKDKEGRDVVESWEMLSTAELRAGQGGGQLERFAYGGRSGGEPLIEGSRTFRLWQRDPMFSQLADSPMRAVLDLCEELVILTLVVRARALSRLAGNGILFVPNELTLRQPAAQQAAGAAPENMEDDPLLTRLIQSLLAPIEDIESPSSQVPLLIRGPGEAGEFLKHISVRDTQETFPENALRDQTIHRLFLGLDMPPESGEGIGDINHWGGWQVERDAWRHAEPVAKSFCDDMTAAYLQPAIRAEAEATNAEPIGDPTRYVVLYDDSEILTNPDRGEDAKAALTAGAIGYSAYRVAMGWRDGDTKEESDAPTEEEIPMMLAFLGKTPPPQDPAVDGAQTGPPAQDQPADPQAPEASANGAGAILASAAAVNALVGASEMAIRHHRRLAGAKIRTAAQTCPPCREQLDGVANSIVAATLGIETCVDLGVADADDLITDRELAFTSVAGKFVGDRSAKLLSDLVAHHAARTLWMKEPPPFPLSALQAVIEGYT